MSKKLNEESLYRNPWQGIICLASEKINIGAFVEIYITEEGVPTVRNARFNKYEVPQPTPNFPSGAI